MSGAIATAAIIGGIGVAGSIGGAAIASHGAGQAAKTQASAADYSAQLQYQASQNALAFQKQQYAQQQQNLQPFLQSGVGGLANLDYLLGVTPQGAQQPASGATPSQGGVSAGMGNAGGQSPIGINGARPMMVNPQGTQGGYNPLPSNVPVRPNPGGPMIPGTGMAGAPAGTQPTPGAPAVAGAPPPGVNTALGGFGSLMQPYGQQFTAPDALTEQNDPGYQARLSLGTDAIQRSAAARGNVLTGGTAKALDTYAQDYASNEYGNVYNRAFNQYAQNYNQYQQQQANQYNRLASLAGIGQQTAGQLGLLGNQAAQGISSNLLGTAANMGQQYNNAAAATASGYVGSANAWGGAVGNAGNSLSNLLMLQQLGGGGSANYGGGGSNWNELG